MASAYDTRPWCVKLEGNPIYRGAAGGTSAVYFTGGSPRAPDGVGGILILPVIRLPCRWLSGRGWHLASPTGVNIPPPLPGSTSDLQKDIKRQARCGTATDGSAQLFLCSPFPEPALLPNAPPGWS